MNNIDRREFLTLLGTGFGALATGSLSGCGAYRQSDVSELETELETALETVSTGPVLPNRFPASMVRASREELDVDLYTIAGRLPSDVYGHAFTVAAVPFGDGTPIVNGDGIMYRLDFGGSRVGLRSRISKTPCYYADRATRGTHMGFRNRGIVRMSQALGTRNEANTAFVCLGERLVVTFDGGRPYEVDPVSLELVTPIGRNDEWAQGMPPLLNATLGGPFKPFFSCAHPYWDENTREFFIVNFTGTVPFMPVNTFLLRWDGEGDLERFRLVLGDGRPARITMSAHQLAVTRDYVVVVDTAFLVEAEQMIFSGAARAETPDTVLYLVRRADLRKGGGDVPAKRLVLPREIAHLVADYENPQGRITLHLPHGSGWLPSEWLRGDDVETGSGAPVRKDLLGMLVASSDATPVARYVLDGESGRLLDAKLFFHDDFTWSVNLYAHRGAAPPGRVEEMYWTSVGFQPELLTRRVFDRSRDYKYRHTALSQLPFAEGKRATLFRTARTMNSSDADGYVFPQGRAVSSPQFLPSARGTGPRDGYVVCTVMSDDTSTPNSSGDEFWIFDARDLARGPVCRLGHPLLDLGYTLHTTWMPEIRPRTASYLVPARKDFEPFLRGEGPAVRALFEQEVYPHFG